MIELPEAINIAKQLRVNVAGKRIAAVRAPSKLHKFCWFNGDPADYSEQLCGASAVSAESFGLFAEISFDNGKKLCINDGVNVRFSDGGGVPANYQLLIEFSDGCALAFTVTMYGGIVLHDDDYDNEYYLKSKKAVSVFGQGFDDYYFKTLAAGKPSLSAKAFLSTEQRFPGLGNGVLQDILLASSIHPKRKISTLTDIERRELLYCVKAVVLDMTEKGGRDTEKDIFGREGGYKTRLSQRTVARGCPRCGGKVVKESYLGGSVYYCPDCQPLGGV